ncbi:bifunctional diaminohydroxyphosphoribosylaminopyrimidine deaminase/5-amino-6-(5-phosphoribosylamino)uracil reductase RibD [Polynucleobacter sp.]|uniref:bifunctional diaminohydroxyphosphoribosylaminopyrimidine deaminase/5-amino-6-(5-phosphoribosylamino)uracil reductase RibD n=1 Tax=Polynucleobacter sp. TaxID=2029855 RepID=UPI0027343F2E|nr:bifunctional diaminohydroxyphosphoribosylaminopyrimidine deaminase/5-amino-6-(5-phosphoribosylamino)uracil reductase RibD [Polynucleobacter sp.]MDP3122687.1 bifunctional diaminohydroxyphosphoribosylaminopyrimidine deaminase/5-amino-6-(5-phosphoribosylamino)uracil reductase RibD [Polynucleobacter sp.]
MFTQDDADFMRLALAEAQKSLYLSNPNPRVGCVIVNAGQVIGTGFTQKVGLAHAEVEALADARKHGADLSGSTIYVSLEPCCHVGRTPPCTQAIIAAKPARVVIAMQDPNPLVGGKGIQQMAAAGIQVECGLLEEEAAALILGFVSRMTRQLPWVRLKVAASLDGKTALPNGQSQWITGAAARDDGHRWRAQACAILTGVGTVKEDDPSLTVRAVDTLRQPKRIIIDSKLDIPLTAAVLRPFANGSASSKDGGAMVVCGEITTDAQLAKQAQLQAQGVEVISMPNSMGKVDLPALMRYLATECEMNEIHVEAGHKLNGSLLREGCVDELLVYLAPTLLGSGLGIANLPELTSLTQRTDWKRIDCMAFDPDIRLRFVRQ